MITNSQILKKLKKSPISQLTTEELDSYIKYRLKNLLGDKKLLVKREVEYLLGETGIGSRRIDPELLSYFTKEEIFISDIAKIIPNIESLKNQKLYIQSQINESLYSDNFIKSFIHLLSNYCKKLNIQSKSPFIVYGEFKNFPIIILIKNGEWVMPNQEFMNFINTAKKQKRLPIIVAKKIHGILYPLFKIISCIGTNMYCTFINEDIIKIAHTMKSKSRDSSIENIGSPFNFEYNEKLNAIKDLSQNITSEEYSDYLLKTFFESSLPKIVDQFFKKFNKLQFNCTNTFDEFAKNLPKGKYQKSLLNWLKYRKKLKL